MPGKIFIEYYHVSEPNSRTSDRGHLLLVYEDEHGQEFVIRGGQRDESILGTAKQFFLDQFTPSFGPILVDAGLPAEASRDYGNRVIHSTKETRRELTPEELHWRDPEDVWRLMVMRAQEIGIQQIDYHLGGPNSNSVITSVLESVGIDIRNVLPAGTEAYQFEGYEDRLPLPDALEPTKNQD